MASLALAMLGATACDDIKEEDRLIPVEREHSDKVVLIEEFTGAMCVNCPTGAAAVHSMLESEAFKGKIIAVSLYPSQMPDLTTPFDVDLRTEAATEYFSAYNGTSIGLPSAMFDRTAYKGSVLITKPATWSGVVTEMLKAQAPVSIELEKNYDAATRKLTVDYKVEYIDPLIDETCMQLYLTENKIISFQLSLAGPILDYENNHVLRAPINGIWGETLGTANTPGTVKTGSASITLDDDWKAENVQVVGFVYRAAGRQVLQAHQLNSIID